MLHSKVELYHCILTK